MRTPDYELRLKRLIYKFPHSWGAAPGHSEGAPSALYQTKWKVVALAFRLHPVYGRVRVCQSSLAALNEPPFAKAVLREQEGTPKMPGCLGAARRESFG